ncbi:hypothetical protein STEG23_021922, partial [Scotinomys teguina]
MSVNRPLDLCHTKPTIVHEKYLSYFMQGIRSQYEAPDPGTAPPSYAVSGSISFQPCCCTVVGTLQVYNLEAQDKVCYAPPPFFASLCPPIRVALVGGGWRWALGTVDITSPWALQPRLSYITATGMQVARGIVLHLLSMLCPTEDRVDPIVPVPEVCAFVCRQLLSCR